MYNIGDEDLAKAYDPKKVASKMRPNKLPNVECNLECDLLRVRKDRAPNAGNLYEFKFQVTKSSSDSVPVGAVYTEPFYPGASDVDYAQFWEKITPILMAVKGETNVANFNAAEALGELKGLCDEDSELELKLPYKVNRTLEPCKPNKKTGEIKHKNADGTPRIFPRDRYFAA